LQLAAKLAREDRPTHQECGDSANGDSRNLPGPAAR
jgi:hypothetical protein